MNHDSETQATQNGGQAAPVKPAPAGTPGEGDDPIFAAIEHAKHAIARTDKARAKDAAGYDKLPKKEYSAVDAALDTEPRTAAGVIALLLFAGEYGAECNGK